LNQEEFENQVRDALSHLYDYRYLDGHPLALQCFPDVRQGGPSRAERFNRFLLETIEELNPPDTSTREASRARFYALLVYRYVEEWPLPDIMHELGYSRSTFFREQRKAVAMLASAMRRKPELREPQQGTPSYSSQDDILHAEADRLLAQREHVDLAQVVQGALKVASNLAERHGVALTHDFGPGSPFIYGSRTLLRQVFLTALNNLTSQPGIQEVHVRMRHGNGCVVAELSVRRNQVFSCDGTSPKPGFSLINKDDGQTSEAGHPGRHEPDLEPVRRLVEAMGGRWHGLEASPEGYTCRFDLQTGTIRPIDREKTVLVIEDNEGIIRVFRGYLAAYGYRVVGATSSEDALRLARDSNPAAITLDIMMPTQDGWEILQVLKDNPATRHIPVIICSVLQDPELALSLGAAAYLSKPVTEADLLSVLDRLSGEP
jgi:CheY-like chemotaxis protein